MSAPLVVIVGETASGKSDLAIELAKKFNGEIICADSRTIYKGMNIGTAKPSKEDQQSIPHHLLDVVSPGQKYSAAQFQKDAIKLINDISIRGKLPIMVGGSGLYIDSVIFNYQFSGSDAPRDPVNPRHLQKSDTSTLSNKQQLRPNTLVIGIKLDREILEQRIKARLEQMVEHGLVEEVKTLGKKYSLDNEAINGIGYKFMGQYIRGEISLEEAKSLMIKGDLSLAKRQRTWFKRNQNINWITDKNQAEELVKTFLNHSE